MSQDPRPTPEVGEEAEKPSKAREMFVGKVKITDGKELSYCEWSVVGAGDQWTYSATMPLKGGTIHKIVMGTDRSGHFLREAHSKTREEACEAVRAHIATFLRRQPRWRVIDAG